MLWTGRILGGLPAILMLVGLCFAIAKPEMRSQMSKYGYTGNAVWAVLAAEGISVILYLIPQTCALGAILLTGYLGGAVATHVSAGEAMWPVPVIVGVVFWLGVYFRDARVRALVPFRKL
jgi:hypothetical protein